MNSFRFRRTGRPKSLMISKAFKTEFESPKDVVQSPAWCLHFPFRQIIDCDTVYLSKYLTFV